MTSLFSKLKLKDQKQILIVNAPASFEAELDKPEMITVLRDPADTSEIGFSLAFVTRQDELDTLIHTITAKAKGDAILWFAYPKKSSKHYACEFNRDTGWLELGKAGYEGVRQVAIDEDWSALRFRRTEFIKTMRRDSKMALSVLGKKRTSDS